jgi:hypothetical protein
MRGWQMLTIVDWSAASMKVDRSDGSDMSVDQVCTTSLKISVCHNFLQMENQSVFQPEIIFTLSGNIKLKLF